MSVSNGSELYTAVTNWLSRTSTSDAIANRVPEFISLFEAHANRTLRVRQMETSTTLALSSAGAATLPTDYLAWRAVEYDTGSRKVNLEYVDRPWMSETYPLSAAGIPSVFTIEGSNLQLMPAATSCVTFRYYQRLTALSTGTTSSNWLLGVAPDAYLYGSLVEAQGFLSEPEKMGGWMARRDAILADIIRLHQKTKAPAWIRPQGVYTP